MSDIGSETWLSERFPEKDWHRHPRTDGGTDLCDGTPSDCLDKARCGVGNKRVAFSSTVVMDDDGSLVGVEMECLVCGERGWKAPDAQWEHALTHLSDEEALRWPQQVILSRQMLDHLEQLSGLAAGGSEGSDGG